MKRLSVIAAIMIAALAGPAQAQGSTAASPDMMEALDFEVLREVVGELNFEINDEGVDQDGDYYFEVEANTGLMFYLYGASCSGDDPATGCLGLNMVATFNLDSDADTRAVMESISYAFMKVYRSDIDVKIARYVIFDGGISRANMKANVSVFAEIGDLIWEQLIDDGVLED